MSPLLEPCSEVGSNQSRLRISECALGEAEAHAHLSHSDRTGLGVEDLDARLPREIIRIDDVGDEGAAERHDDFCAAVDHGSDERRSRFENLVLAALHVPVNVYRDVVCNEIRESQGTQDEWRSGKVRV